MRPLFIICMVFLLTVTRVQARIIEVGAGTNNPTIRMALGLAIDGDTLRVHAGTYKEGGLVITRPLVIMGTGWPVLDGEDKYEIMAIRADNVQVMGLNFRRPGHSSLNDIAALRIYYRSEATIRENRFEHSYFAIYSQGASHCRIIGNTISSDAQDEISSGNGIHCWKCDGMEILRNTITGHRDGIYFEFVTNSIISGNESHGNVRYGLHFMFSHHDTYNANKFRDNGSGVAVMYSNQVTMVHNSFSGNWGSAAYGILMKDISDSRVIANRFDGNTTALHLEGCSRTRIEGNEFSRNGWAIRIQASCENDVITTNNFTGNTFDIATNGSLVLNTFSGNYWDRYEGYDLNHDGTGDLPYRPVSMYSMIVERNPSTLMLLHSFIVGLLDKAERVIPSFTPADLADALPRMRRIALTTSAP